MKTAVIFGVTGQDGSYLAELLLDKGYKVVGVSRRTSTPNDARVRHLANNPAFSCIRGDVTDPMSVRRCIAGGWALNEVGGGEDPVEVYNLAAQSHVGDSFAEPYHTTNATYLGCLNVLEAIRSEAEWSLGGRVRFYQASSSEMFGSSFSVQEYDGGDGYLRHWSAGAGAGVPKNAFQNELTPFLPCSPYGIAKLAAHHLCRVYRESYGIFACSGILFNHESERRSEAFVTRKITKYVSRWAYARRHEEALPPLKLGNLKAKRDWGHAADFVRAMWLMLQQGVPGDYVVCTGETHTVEEFLLKAFAAGGLKAESVESLPVEIDSTLFRPCEVPYLRGDASKTGRALDWRPEVSFDDLVKRMVYSDMADMWGDAYAERSAAR